MHRCLRALAAVLLAAAWPAATLAAGPPFPEPVNDQAVYDEADIFSDGAEQEAERIIDGIESLTGAEVVVYTQVDDFVSEDENLNNAKQLIDQWGIGRSGFDDGLVLMVGMSSNGVNGKISLYGGAGYLGAYANEDDLKDIIDQTFVPAALSGDFDRAVLDSLDEIAERTTPEQQKRLETLRVLNAGIGLIAAPLALIGSLFWAWRTWRREGDDPELTDSPSILMAGPPAEMTPPLATVIRDGTGSGHTINVLLAELASTGRLTFHNLDQVRSARSDAAPDPLTDPAIEVHAGVGDDDRLAGPEREAWTRIVAKAGAGGGRLSRERLWSLNSELNGLRRDVEREAVRLGWLERLPGPSINRMSGIGLGLAVLGGGAIWLGISIPMSGAVMLGGALVLGGIGTFLFARAMSQRTKNGAYVDSMLVAYRRTLRKTMDQARSMGEVVEQPEIAKLADTTDKAVVWGLALGLHDEVAALLARGLEQQRTETGSPAGAYYPTWLGASSGSSWSGASAADLPGGVSYGSGSIFSGSAMPDIGGMFDALGSVGSTPPSSSSSSSGGGGGGFSGGGGGGGGGSSGSF
jgi:uncharacterized membrane protein YgcG